jgi:salicylate hydroxylase
MRANFTNWDPVPRKFISLKKDVFKWKLCNREELDKWSKGNFLLIGDAVHPTLPYQAQGAAMATEDGYALGIFLGRIHGDKQRVQDVLKVLRMRESRGQLQWLRGRGATG